MKSPEQLALLQEELQSPCYEEVAVFQAFARAVMSGRKEFTVIDTAPTGHTLLLLRHGRQLPSPDDRIFFGRRTRSHASDDASGQRLHENPYRRASRNDAGARSERASGRSSPRRDRALCLGDQCEFGGRPPARSVVGGGALSPNCRRSSRSRKNWRGGLRSWPSRRRSPWARPGSRRSPNRAQRVSPEFRQHCPAKYGIPGRRRMASDQ